VFRSFGYGIVPVLLVAVGLVPRAEAGQPGVLRLGLLQGMFKDVPDALVDAAAKPFAEMFQKQSGVKGEVEIVPDWEHLAARLKEGKLDIGVFHGFEYAWVRDRYPEIEPLAVTIPPHRKVQACLVVNTESPAASAKDLKGACVVVPVRSKAHCRLFLDCLRADLPADCCGYAKHDPLYPDEVLDGIAQKQYTAALVDISALLAYQANKPGPFRQLRVLSQSELLPPAVVAYRKGAIPEAAVAKLRDGLTPVKDNAHGRAFLMMWQLQGFEAAPASFDADMKRVTKLYPAPSKASGDKIAMPE